MKYLKIDITLNDEEIPEQAEGSCAYELLSLFKIERLTHLPMILGFKETISRDSAGCFKANIYEKLAVLAKWVLKKGPNETPDSYDAMIEFVDEEFADAKKGGWEAQIQTIPFLTKPKDMPSFTGKAMDWPQWKDQALAVFKIAGLYEVVSSRSFANNHPTANTTVHGLLVNVLAGNSNVAFCCIDPGVEPNDGHGSWKRLEKLFEQPKLIELLLDTQHDLIKELKLKTNGNLEKYIGDFMSCMNRILQYRKWCNDIGFTSMNQRHVDWKRDFLENITDSKFISKRNQCKSDPSLDIHSSIVELRVAEYDYNKTNRDSTEPEKRTSRTTEQIQIKRKQDEKKPEGNSNNPSGPTLAALWNAAGDDDEAKNILRGILAKAKGSNTQGKSTGGGRKRARFEKKQAKFEKRRKQSSIPKEDEPWEVEIDEEIRDVMD
jgi:hypothetical protein